MRIHEVSNHVRTFQLGDDPILLHIIKTGFKDEYIVVTETGFATPDHGQSEILSKQQILDKYKNSIMKRLLILALLITFKSVAHNLDSIVVGIAKIESNFDVNAIGDNGKAYGLLQIHKEVVDDVNRYYGTTYTHDEMFDSICAVEVFQKYINIGIKRYQKKYKKSPDIQHIVRMWNGGIYRGYRIDSTKKYWIKYKQYVAKKRILTNEKSFVDRQRNDYSSTTKNNRTKDIVPRIRHPTIRTQCII